MRYKMNLWSDSFEAVKSGLKTIEMRLYDEKRALIKIDESNCEWGLLFF